MSSPSAVTGSALEQTEIPPELFLSFRGLRDTPLFFSDYCRKLTTHKGVTITRVIICTAEHLYLCHPNGDILRCFPFTAVTKIFHDEQRHQVGIVIPCEFDLAVETPLSFQLVHVIDVLRRMHGAKVRLDVMRVEPVARPKGLLGLRSDGTLVWDKEESNPIYRKRSQRQRTCGEKMLDCCGLREGWITFKDGCYRYYRRVMRSLDLGIEDDDEVLTTAASASSSASAASAASVSTSAVSSSSVTGSGSAAGSGAGGGGGSGFSLADTMMLAAGKSFASIRGAVSSSSRKSFIMNSAGASAAAGSSGESNNKGKKRDGQNDNNEDAASSDVDADAEAADEVVAAGYRWFRPCDSDNNNNNNDGKGRSSAAKSATKGRNNTRSGSSTFEGEDEDQVLNLLLSPMLADQNQQQQRSPFGGGADFMDSWRDQWWPGSQIGSPDGPYALALAKPHGFRVALDQRNSEFV